MKLIEEGNLDHLKGHRCHTCGTLFDLTAADLVLKHRMEYMRNETAIEYFTWDCSRCAHQNKLVVTTYDNGTVTTSDSY